jgi:hypothetical protein
MTPQSAIILMLTLDAVILIPLFVFNKSRSNKRMAALLLAWFTISFPIQCWFKANRWQWSSDLLLMANAIPLLLIPLFGRGSR